MPCRQATSDVVIMDVTVIYVAGSSRCGSTLVERTLGEMSGFVNVGELIDLFRRVAPRGELCGCGQVFESCQFWIQVGARAFGGWDPELLAQTHLLQRDVSRQRRFPQLLALPLASHTFRDKVARYGSVYLRLYQAIASEADARYVVDASKWPVQALALHRAGVDVRVIHLVRDVRGVANSLSRSYVPRPHAVREEDVMWHVGPAGAAAQWMTCQSEAALLRRCGLAVTRMRYEDFVSQPRGSIEVALAELGVPASRSSLAHIGNNYVVLGASHGLSGNPSRFQAGNIELRADEAWRSQMSWRQRTMVMAIGFPHMLRHRRKAPAQFRPATDQSDRVVGGGGQV
jgi:hypothetical protein